MVFKNAFGYYEVEQKPTEAELNEYYQEKYYQIGNGHYQKKYSLSEKKYLNNKLSEKLHIIKEKYPQNNLKKFLDIGAGEGWALKFFKENGFKVTGVDYSDYGCKCINPELSQNLVTGNIFDSIENLIQEDEKFDVILIDNVLEHVLTPLGLLISCKKLLAKNGALVIEVPNDFSEIQKYLLNNERITNEFWVKLPDHLSYFNRKGLEALCKKAEWIPIDCISDYPIDLNLLNSNTNYIIDPSKGKSCHEIRIETDNLLHSISIEKTISMYRAMADLGMGRQIISFFTLK